MNNTKNTPILSNALDSRTGFNIGDDYAAYSLPLPENSSRDIEQGYKACKRKSKAPATIYTRKWLGSRSNAYKRGIHFSEQFTPDYIEELVSLND